MRRKLLATLLIFVMTLVFVPMASFGASEEDQLEKVQKNKAKVNEDIVAIGKRIQKQQSSIEAMEVKISAKQKQVNKNEKKLNKTIANIGERNTGLNMRLRTMYKNGSIGYIDVILGSNSLSELISNVDMVQRIYKNDQTILTDLKDRKTSIERQQEKLAAEKAELSSAKEKYVTEKNKMEEEKSKLQKQYKAYKEEEERIEAEIAKREAELIRKKILSGGKISDKDFAKTAKGNGSFIYPVHGPITEYFGASRSWDPYATNGHKGMDIGCATGTPVHASGAGVVVEAGWYGGYGNAVVIAHGNGLRTLYGHNSSLKVSVGQSVKQGDVIAYAGNTGYSFGSHCHFEFQLNGTPVDPMNYCGRVSGSV